MTAILAVEELKVRFRSGGETIEAVRDASLDVAAAECVGIVGESGSGKTVMFMAAMGLLPKDAHTDGRIRFEGVDLLGRPARELNRVRGSRLAMIFQDPMTSLTPHLTIGTQLTEVLVSHARLSWRDARLAALDMLERVRLPQPVLKLAQYPHELSGGMRQRVMIAMSLLCKPSLLIADEPTTALDVTVQAEIIQLLRALRADLELATVLISHDLGVVAGLADRVVVMYAGRIVESGTTAALLRGALHPYTAALLNCVPQLKAPRLPRMPFVPGSAPRASSRELGCAFAPRCAAVRDRCRSERPSLASGGATDRQVACHFPLAT